jgi:hypothetical protein
VSVCEDYPCCGHARGECNDDTGLTEADHYARMSRGDYDPYYDEGDY